MLPRLLHGYFREARIQAELRFGSGVLAVENSPDLYLREGAGICAEARVRQGRLSFPQPLRLGGFYALGGLYDFCAVDTDAAGKIRLKSCFPSLPKDSDITEPVLKGPLARAFPEKKIHPLPLADLLKAFTQSPEAGGGDDPLLSALRQVTLKAEIPGETWVVDPPGTPGGSCHPLSAGLEAYLDLPRLKDNLAAGLWRSFDFSGLERGSKVLWPHFDLSRLPLPEGWSIPEGLADLEIRYFPEEGATRLQIRNMKARAQIAPLFGESEIILQGAANLVLRRGGEIELEAEGLRVETPLNAIEGAGLPNLSVILDGSARGSFKNGSFALAGSRFSLRDLQWQVPKEHPAPLGSSGLSWFGTLVGQGEVEYEGAGRTWKRLDFELSGDLAILQAEGASLLKAEGLSVDLKGDSQRLTLEGDAVALNYGAAAIEPRFSFVLKPKLEGEDWGMDGEGTLKLRGLNVPLALVSELELKAGAKQGELKLPSIAFDYDGRSWTRKGRAELQWSEQGLAGRIRLPDLPGGNALDLRLRRTAESERIAGSFQFRPSRLPLASGLFAEDLKVSGSFTTDPWSSLLAKPRMSLKARVEGKLDGGLSGPFDADLQGSLSYSPARRSVFLWLDPRRGSELRLGPLSLPGESRTVEGEFPLKGTWQAVLLPKGILIGGRGVGIQGGEVRVGDGSSRAKAVEGFDLVADQLWSVQNGIAYAGGEGIRLEARVEPSVWLGSNVQGLGSRKVFLITDQLPLSAEAYWRLFVKSLKAEGGR
ncbi:MAG TPA: hypothetical protein VJR29_12975 [bacterium]|nr:hypothetical protein [bacterium]